MAKAQAQRGVRRPLPTQIYQLRIALRYIKPPIWRRVMVPDNWRLGDLHPLFLSVMGWAGYHLHAFRFGDRVNQQEYAPHSTEMECGSDIRDENSFFLNQVIDRRGQVFTYEYDFGDGWLHEVKVEKILPYDPAVVLPVCVAGERACPPEDCGGFPGYDNILRVLARPKSRENRELREWVGEYDPEHFNLAAINWQLQPPKASKRR